MNKDKIKEILSSLINPNINSYELNNILKANLDSIIYCIDDLANYYKKLPKWLLLKSNEKNEFLIVGDIHGDYNSLLNVMFWKNFFKDINIIFLGDFVDRGPKSNEVILTALLLNYIFKDSIFIIPGNHELYKYFQYQNPEFWQQEGIITKLYEPLGNLIENLPLIINIDNDITLLHGGFFSYDLNSNKDIEFINIIKKENKLLSYLIKNYEEKVFELAWADYCENEKQIIFSKALGRPAKLEKDILKVFNDFGTNLIIRGHQPDLKGVSFNSKLITLLTSSIYSNAGFINGNLVTFIYNNDFSSSIQKFNKENNIKLKIDENNNNKIVSGNKSILILNLDETIEE